VSTLTVFTRSRRGAGPRGAGAGAVGSCGAGFAGVMASGAIGSIVAQLAATQLDVNVLGRLARIRMD